MKKRPVIGLTVAVLVASVVLGIASLPDEVLIDSTAIENSQTTQADVPQVTTVEESQEFVANALAQQNIDAAQAEIDALKKEMRELQNELVDLKIDSQAVDDSLETKEKEMPPKKESQEKSGGKVIKVKIDDGVGAKMR